MKRSFSNTICCSTTFKLSNGCVTISEERWKHWRYTMYGWLIILIIGSVIHVNGQSLTWLGTLGGNSSKAFDASADGSVVVGTSVNSSGHMRAFRWQNGVMQDLGTLGGNFSEAFGVSSDGSVVVGYASTLNDSEAHAYRWENGVMEDLGTLGGDHSEALDVSADGSFVVGWARTSEGYSHAFIWSNGSMEDKGTLGGDESKAVGVSLDNSTAVGWAENSDGVILPVIFQGQALTVLDTVTGYISYPSRISSDGSIIVGGARNQFYEYYAIRWINGTWEKLGSLGGIQSAAWDVSADGSIIVGWAHDASAQQRAFRFRNGNMEDLNVVYGNLLTWGSRLVKAYDISPDGRFIVGVGINSATNNWEGFLLDTSNSTDIYHTQNVPEITQLYQNYPNPFNPATNIRFNLNESGFVILKIYNLLGQEVKTLVNKELSAGLHNISFDASGLQSGTYIYRIQSKNFTATKKMVLIK